jgi:hypothetical protein
MEITTAPLTVLRSRNPGMIPRDRLSSTSSSLSSLSYPQIPTRRSSLSANMEYDSSEQATSTRTPSLSDSLYNIDVVKVRQDHGAASRDIHKTGLDFEDPFVDHVIAFPVSNFFYLLTHYCRRQTAVLASEMHVWPGVGIEQHHNYLFAGALGLMVLQSRAFRRSRARVLMQ